MPLAGMGAALARSTAQSPAPPPRHDHPLRPCPRRPAAARLHTLAALALLACLGSATHAQSTAATLGEVVVSGSRHEQAADELPLSYDVIDASTLGSQQSRTLREALQDLPNASVKRSPARFAVGGTTASAGRDGNVGINIRGWAATGCC
ncbi:hypothetical protein [Alicycliphilus denitrificans]|uniref:hypothetical protein n=1 Tax=Alicycliphilus denitrificans TaxID=179636 RepID=UPI00384A9AC8